MPGLSVDKSLRQSEFETSVEDSSDLPSFSQEKYGANYFRKLVDDSIQGFCIHQNKRIEYANKTYAALHGYELEEIIGREITLLIFEDDLPRFEERNAARYEQDLGTERYEIRGKRKDGSAIWLDVSVCISKWNNLPATQAAVVDIAKIKDTEKRLQESEQRFKDFAESSSDFYWEMGADLRFTFFSDRFYKKYPFTPEQVLGKSRRDMVDEPIDENMRTHLEDLDNCREFRRFEYWVSLGEKPYCFSISGVPVFDAKGDFRGYRGTGTDITERKIAEEALAASEASSRESKHRLSAMMNAVPDAVVTIDAESKIQSFNPAAERIFGYSAAEAVGENAKILMPEEAQVRHEEGLNRFLQTGESKIIGKRHEATAQHKDGSTFPIEIAINWMEIPAGLMFLGVCQDITERKRIESEKTELEQTLQQSHKMEAIGTLAGGIAHDINNTLVPILGLVELMQADVKPDDENFENLEMIATASERIKELVGQILTFSRKEDEQKKVIEIGVAVDETIPLLRSTLPSTIEIQNETDKCVGMVPISPAQIHQIVLNLATNASHAMEDGGVLVVTTKQINVDQELLNQKKDLDIEPGSYALLAVSDTGCGIDDETLTKIFDPFFTTRGVGEGTGMGLSVVHGIVTACGGTVAVSSTLGQGTVFELYVPIVAERQTNPRKEGEILEDETTLIGQVGA